MESRFERITESPDALAAVLASIPTADAPWDIAFERAFCAGCALENCDGCPHKNLVRIKWWLEQQTAKAFLTRKGKRSGWFSMSKKQELVDKLGPIEHQTEELLEELCGNYCRYTSAANGKTRDELLDICEDCPLSRLRDLIGV